MSEMPEQRLREIEARWAAATPPPWRWQVNLSSKSLDLISETGWGLIVMNFWRWGMQRARPWFRNFERCVMEPALFIPRYADGHNPWDAVGIDHPDAIALAASAQDIKDLLAEVRRLQRECDRRDIMAAWSEDILSDEDAFRLMGLEQTDDSAFNDLYGYWSGMRGRAYELDEKAKGGSHE